MNCCKCDVGVKQYVIVNTFIVRNKTFIESGEIEKGWIELYFVHKLNVVLRAREREKIG